MTFVYVALALVLLAALTWWVLSNRDTGTHDQPDIQETPESRADR